MYNLSKVQNRFRLLSDMCMYAMMNLCRLQHTNSVDPKQILKVQVKFKNLARHSPRERKIPLPPIV